MCQPISHPDVNFQCRESPGVQFKLYYLLVMMCVFLWNKVPADSYVPENNAHREMQAHKKHQGKVVL